MYAPISDSEGRKLAATEATETTEATEAESVLLKYAYCVLICINNS